MDVTRAKQLETLAQEWIRLDPNETTRAEMQSLWDSQQLEELEKRLIPRIQFGTAGLRGKMEAGWARMNDLIILQTAQGLADYVLKEVHAAQSRGLVVGYDHRFNSERWAQLTAQIFYEKGFKIYFLSGFNHTPMVPFAIKKMKAACGVMITASHNPKDDNGFKVYWENGVQIISPHDKEISATINVDDVTSVVTEVEIIIADSADITAALQSEYLQYLKTIIPGPRTTRNLPAYVNTSMHGVGDQILRRAFDILGFEPYIPVVDQQEPDPTFNTVHFPNPEEKGALDMALRTADQAGAKYVLAQDPDADRFCAAEKLSSGKWQIFTGDQLGAIFASRILAEYAQTGQPKAKLAMVSSTVSSKMLSKMAQIEEFKYEECLTGFKFIGNTAINLEHGGHHTLFGYEEAIGFMFGNYIRDKDGVAATLQFVQLLYDLSQINQSISEYLENLYLRYGFFETKNGYVICQDPDIILNIFDHIRNYQNSGTYPATLGGIAIQRVIDLTTGYDSGNGPTFKPLLPLSSGQMIQFSAADTSDQKLFLTLRTSGTEPKIKFYLEGSSVSKHKVQELLCKALNDIVSVWIQVDFYNLQISS